MCLTFIPAFLVSVSVSFSAATPVAQYSDLRGIELNPVVVCEWNRDTQLFAIFHEEAHHRHNHLQRRLAGESVKAQEIEADMHAIRRLRNLGYDPCVAVKPLLWFRPERNGTHPSAWELEQMACKQERK